MILLEENNNNYKRDFLLRVMRVDEKTKEEISSKLKEMGDYVKMGYLKDCLKKSLDFETRKFVLVSLAFVYEKRKMFADAGKMYRVAAEINTTFEGKTSDFVKSVEMFIKAGSFMEADVSFSKAIANSNSIEKNRVIEAVKEYYKNQARLYQAKDKRRNAMEVYEKLLRDFQLNIDEKRNVNSELLEIYNRLGKVKDYMSLKKKL